MQNFAVFCAINCVISIMRHYFLLLFFTAMSSIPSMAQRYELVWAENFDVDGAPASQRWVYETGNGTGNLVGWGNGELQYYTADSSNVKVRDGHLIITARKQVIDRQNYTSARIKTQFWASFKYGRIEVRAKLPRGQGMWPAIWMLPANNSLGWPRSGEIDIMEGRGNTPDQVEGTVHYWRAGCTGTNALNCREFNGKGYTLSTGNFTDEFHVFSIEWTKDGIDWFVDGNKYHSIRKNTLNADWYPFDEPFYFILNVAVGGNFFGANANVVDDHLLPQSMTVDYIHVYQDANQSPTVNLSASAGTKIGTGVPVTLVSNAADSDGSVAKVDFFYGTQLLDSVKIAPFELALGPISDGCHEFNAVAYDNEGKESVPGNPLRLTVGTGCERRPYVVGGIAVPGTLQLTDYDFGGQGIGYYDTMPFKNLGNNTGNDRRVNEGVDILKWVLPDTTVYLVGHTERDEWMEYTITTTVDDSYFIDLTGVGNTTRGSINLSLNGTFLISMSFSAQQDTSIVVRSTFSALPIPAGTHKLRVSLNNSGLRLGTLTFRPLSTSIDEIDNRLPTSFILEQNHPNPFNPETTISFTVGMQDLASVPVKLSVYDILGREVAVLVDGMVEAGRHQVRFQANSLPSGVYMYILEHSDGVLTNKMILLK